MRFKLYADISGGGPSVRCTDGDGSEVPHSDDVRREKKTPLVPFR